MTAPGWNHNKADTTFAEKARQYILEAKNSESPFFLYLATSAPHEPCVENVVPEIARGKSSAGPRGDLVWLVDWIVGQVLKTLEETDQIDDTLIFVTSDNGALPGDRVVSARGNVVFHTYDHKSCGDWRGYKHHIWEGGHREPLIAHWPKSIKGGSICSDLFCLNDIISTLGSLVEAGIPDHCAEDSYNMASTIFGNGDSAAIRQDLIHHSQAGVFSLRKGPWKLIHETLGSGNYSPDCLGVPEPGSPGQLYNLECDPFETNNLFSVEKDIVLNLTNLLNEYRRDTRSVDKNDN